MFEDDLYISGRIKDMLVIKGKNYFSEDIECCLHDLHQHIRPGCIAVFSIHQDNCEKLVVVAEVFNAKLSDSDAADLFHLINRRLLHKFYLEITYLACIKEKTIPKTTSGKIQRGLCKQLFLNNKLELACQFPSMASNDCYINDADSTASK